MYGKIPDIYEEIPDMYGEIPKTHGQNQGIMGINPKGIRGNSRDTGENFIQQIERGNRRGLVKGFRRKKLELEESKN